MVYNPYAKKRARPAEWSSSNSSSLVSSIPKQVPLVSINQTIIRNKQSLRIDLSASSYTSVNKGHGITRMNDVNERVINEHKLNANLLTKNDNGKIAHYMSKPYPNPSLKIFRNGVSSTGYQRSSNHALQESTVLVKSKASFGESSYVNGRTVNCTANNTVATSKRSTLLPSSMASIRPASWKAVGDSIDERPKYSMDAPSSSASKYMQPQAQPRMQTLRNVTSTNSSQHQARQDDNVVGCLPRELSYTLDEVKPIQDKYRMLLIKNAKLSAPLKNGWMLFPHQKKATVRALTMRRMILALDMGLGKTLIGAVWSKAFRETFGRDKLKVFVICPVSLKEEWRRTAEERVGLKVQEEERGKSKSKSKKSARGKEIDPQDEDDGDEGLDLKVSICSWAKVPKQVESHIEHFVVCCDEAHAMQSAQAQRTKDVLNLVEDKRYVGKRFRLQVFCF